MSPLMTRRLNYSSINELLAPYARRAQEDMRRWLVPEGTPDELARAMEYCALQGGKRLRPALVYLCAESLNQVTDEDLLSRSASSVEFVHCYSLVHDDLPAMDDDVLRRGAPTAHVQFGEAMAILAGDALLTRAFEILACPKAQAPALIGELASAAGGAGMIAGQVADMKLCDVPKGLDGLDYIHLRKTAAIIRAACRMGAIAANVNDSQLEAIGRYGRALGLAFQTVDDLLDATASADDLGKTPGKDAAAGKRTHLAELGMGPARDRVSQLSQEAVEAVSGLGDSAWTLRELATLLERRSH